MTIEATAAGIAETALAIAGVVEVAVVAKAATEAVIEFETETDRRLQPQLGTISTSFRH